MLGRITVTQLTRKTICVARINNWHLANGSLTDKSMQNSHEHRYVGYYSEEKFLINLLHNVRYFSSL